MDYTEFTYAATPEELDSMAALVRKHAAHHAQIDPERLSIQVTDVAAFEIGGEEPYIRPSTADAKLDGREFGPDRVERKIRWWVQQTMIAIRRPMDRSRATVFARNGRPIAPGLTTRGANRS
jgi:hypothetical protein